MPDSIVRENMPSKDRPPRDELPISWYYFLPFLILGCAVHTQTNYCPPSLKGMSELLIATGFAAIFWLLARGFFKESSLRWIDILGFNTILLLTISNTILSIVVLYTIQRGDTQCTSLNLWERPLAALSVGLNIAFEQVFLWLIATGLVRGILDWDALRDWAIYKSHHISGYPWVLIVIIVTALCWTGSEQYVVAIVESNLIPVSADIELESLITKRKEETRRRAYQNNGTWLDLTSADFDITVDSGSAEGLFDGDAGSYDLGASSATFDDNLEITISWENKFFSVAAIRIGVTGSGGVPNLEEAVVKHDGVQWASQSITNRLGVNSQSTNIGDGYCTAGAIEQYGWYGGIEFTSGDEICSSTCENDPVCVGFTSQPEQTGTCYVYCIQEYNVGDLACVNEGDTSSLTMASDNDPSVTCRNVYERAWAMIYHDDPNSEVTSSNLSIYLPTDWDTLTIGEIGILGKETTYQPTSHPTAAPTGIPTMRPTSKPTRAPTSLPTPGPTRMPSGSPTKKPTYEDFYHSKTVWVECSNNVEEVECYACYDGHNSIFMNFESSNAELFMESDDCPTSPYDADGIVKTEWIQCEGNWTIRAAATMYMDPTYQGESAFLMWDVWEIGERTIPYDNQTDGRLDVDQGRNSTDWRRYYHFVAQECSMDTPDGGTEDCYLPKQVNSQDNAMACTWKMPKVANDGRTQPIIWSFGDTLATWHSWRPELNYEYKVMNFSELEQGLDFSPDRLIQNFKEYIIFALVVFLQFILITCCACTLDRKVESEYDYSLDVRTFKMVYDTSIKSQYYYNVKRIQMENKFAFKHLPYVVIVLIAGIIKAAMFTFTFCIWVFGALNEQHIYNLSENYPIFADERDTQLMNMHYTIEDNYDTELDRMDHEFALIEDDCYGGRISEMQDGYDTERTRIGDINDEATNYENIRSQYATGNETNKTWAFHGYHPCIIPDTIVSYEDSVTYTVIVQDTGNSGECIAMGESDPQTREECELYFCYWLPTDGDDPDNNGNCVNAVSEQWSIDKFDETNVLASVELECRSAYWCMGYSYQRVNVTSWLTNSGDIYECKDESGEFLETITVDNTTYYRYELSSDYDGYCSSARTNFMDDYALFLENYAAGECYYCVVSNEGVAALIQEMDEPNYYLFEGNLEAVDMYGLTDTYTNPNYGGWCYEHEEGFAWPDDLEAVAEETEYLYEDEYVSKVETEIENFNDFWSALTTQSEGESCRESEGWVEWEEMAMCILLDDTILGGIGSYAWTDADKSCGDEALLSVFSEGDFPSLAFAEDLYQLETLRDYCYTAFGEPTSDSWCFLQYPMFGNIYSNDELRDYFNYTLNPGNWEGNLESFISFDDASLGQTSWFYPIVKATAPGSDIILSFIRANKPEYNSEDPVKAMCINGYEDSLISINKDPENPYSVAINNAGYSLNEGFFADIGVFCPNCPDSWSIPTLELVDTSTWDGNSTDYDYTVNNDTVFNVEDAVDDVLVTPDENFTYTINTDMFDMPLSFTGLSVDVPVVINLFLSFDALMLIYRITIIAVRVTDLIIGRDKEVSMKYLQHGSIKMNAQARELSDKCCWGLGALLRSYRNIGGTIWYLLPYIFKLCMLVTTSCVILMLYVLVDQIVTTEVLSGFGAFEAMTMGIAVHRTVRNEQIAIRALYINSVSIPFIENSLQTYADSLIVQTYTFNTEELEDINSFNARFCPLLRTYLYTPRDLSYFLGQVYIVGGNDVGTNGYNNVENQGLSWGTLCTSGCTSLNNNYGGGDKTFLSQGLTDGESQTYWQPAVGTYDENGNMIRSPTNNYTVMILEFNAQTELGDLADDGTRSGISFFEVTQLVFTWGLFEVDSLSSYRSDYGIPSYTLTPEAEDGGAAIWYSYADVDTGCDTLTDSAWIEAEYEATSSYDSTSLYTTIDSTFPHEQRAEISTGEAKCVKISWKTADWGGNVQVGNNVMQSLYSLQEINFYGRLPLENAANCPRAVWTEMYYQPSEFNESCEIFTPIHGLSMNEFVRDVWSDKLEEEHGPYMNAMRSILLSPFFIVLILVILLIIFTMLGGMIEMILIRSGLIRENPYAKIPCVLTVETYTVPESKFKNLFCKCWFCDEDENEGATLGVPGVNRDHYSKQEMTKTEQRSAQNSYTPVLPDLGGQNAPPI